MLWRPRTPPSARRTSGVWWNSSNGPPTSSTAPVRRRFGRPPGSVPDQRPAWAAAQPVLPAPQPRGLTRQQPSDSPQHARRRRDPVLVAVDRRDPEPQLLLVVALEAVALSHACLGR